LVVHIGDSVAVRNDGHETHTFDCAGCGVHSGNIAPGQQRAVHFTVAGTFTFEDLYDGGQGMVGTVAVLRPGQATPAPPTPSPGS
jgi:plastocyanin